MPLQSILPLEDGQRLVKENTDLGLPRHLQSCRRYQKSCSAASSGDVPGGPATALGSFLSVYRECLGRLLCSFGVPAGDS